MDLKHLNFSLRTVFCLFVVFFVNASGQLCTAANTSVLFDENNAIGQLVTSITVQEEVTMVIKTNPDEAFGLNGTDLQAVKILDFETLTVPTLLVEIECSRAGVSSPLLRIFVTVKNINDNPPVFAQSHYNLKAMELSAINTNIGRIEATDLDKETLYYTLDPTDDFGLQTSFNPVILVKKTLDYDTTPEISLILYAQDTRFTPPVTPSHTATATITVTVIDINNRPPWFQPCTEVLIGMAKICHSSGYQGTVNLTEQATEALTLQPGPVHAIDGDKNRNEPINYRILSGNEDGLFSMDPNSGDITMLKAVNVEGPIVLTVMAYEQLTPDMYSTTTVTLRVVIKSLHPPKFVKSSYEGFISEDADVGSLVLESKNSNKPLQVHATDDDYANGTNPSIRFEVVGSNDFRITPEGFILMAQSLSPGTADLQMRVVDTQNDESSTASLSVEVSPGVSTTTMDMSTTDMITSPETTEMVTVTTVTTDMATDATITTEMATDATITTDMATDATITTDMATDATITTDMATDATITTDMATNATITTEMATDATITTDMATGTTITTEMATNATITTIVATGTAITTDMATETVTELTQTTSDSDMVTSSPSTTHSFQTDKLPQPVGDFRAEDMAALGASLAVVLLLCLVVIGVLVYHIKRNRSDWNKLFEASVFRSTLNGGSAGPKDGVQYTNYSFQDDEDKGSLDSKEAAELPLPLRPGLKRSVPEEVEKQSSAPVPPGLSSNDTSSPPADSSSLSPSDTTDSEKEVKPILTKERRMEDGYKAVWFKQDIDPTIKEEVVIIPDSGETDVGQDDDEDDDDDEEEEEEEEEEENGVIDTNRSARRTGSDSEEEEDLTSDL